MALPPILAAMPSFGSLGVYLKRLFGLTCVSGVAFVGLLAGCQHSLIYHPSPYKTEELAHAGQRIDLIYTTSQGLQHGFYVPPRAQAARSRPARIWVLFSGNGSRALSWNYFIKYYPVENEGFLLLDYPGYGACAGSASPTTIRESADALLEALAQHLGMDVKTLEPRLAVMGHSLGAATALDFASRHHPSHIVLLAPFTSLRDMARRTVGWPLCYVLMGNFDNRERLREITQGGNSPRIDLLFGKEDEVIPFAMGQELARLYPMVHFEPLEGTGHNDILSREANIRRAMMAR